MIFWWHHILVKYFIKLQVYLPSPAKGSQFPVQPQKTYIGGQQERATVPTLKCVCRALWTPFVVFFLGLFSYYSAKRIAVPTRCIKMHLDELAESDRAQPSTDDYWTIQTFRPDRFVDQHCIVHVCEWSETGSPAHVGKSTQNEAWLGPPERGATEKQDCLPHKLANGTARKNMRRRLQQKPRLAGGSTIAWGILREKHEYCLS